VSYQLGVDLGTTFTSAAVLRGGHVEVVPLGDHAPQIPSVAFRPEKGPLLFGEIAAIRGRTRPDRVAREFKRRMGDQTGLFLGGSPIAAHVLLGQLLAFVVERVTAGQGSEPDGIMLSCPANWGPYRRELMDQVVSVAGLSGARICTEPEAAAVHFASTGRIEEGDTVAVYDLGGGTFDASVLRAGSRDDFVMPGPPEGIEQLGGIDFDAAVLTHVLQTLRLDDVDLDDELVLPALTRLQRECIEAKEALSVETETAIAVDLGPVQTTVRMTRAELEDLIQQPLEQTVSSLLRAVTRAGLAPQDLKAVVIVGGSARIPLVSHLLTERLGRPVAVSSQPKHCVAMGAALLLAPRTNAPALLATTPTAALAATQTSSAPTAVLGPVEVLATKAATPPAPHSASTANGAATTVSPATASHSIKGATSRRRLRQQGAYAALSLAIATVTVLLVLAIPRETPPSELTWVNTGDLTNALPQAVGRTRQVTLMPTLAGIPLPAGDVIRPERDGSFKLGGYRIFVAGPVQGTLTGLPSIGTVQIKPIWGSWWSRLATIPGAVMVLSAMFVAAYSESLLRTVASRRDRIRAGEVLGMAGVGAVAGVLLSLAAWILFERAPTPATIGLSVVGMCAAIGLLPFVVAQRSTRLRESHRGRVQEHH
jgi:molecular chaperone DnaK